MTKDRYLTICEQLGKEPSEKEMPPDIYDFPEIVQLSFHIFSMLGDRVYPDIGYIGKDYTNLKLFIELYGVENVELLLEILNWLDQRAIKKSSEQLKRELDKIKRKSSVKSN